MFQIAMPRLIRVGAGALQEVAGAMTQFELRHPVVITDRTMVERGIAERLEAALAAGGIQTRVFSDTVPEPTVACVNAAVAFIRQGEHDSVIGLGGGSSIDTAKAAAVLAIRGGTMRELKAPHQEDRLGLAVVAIPTTAGTGSEATRFTVITDESNDEKMLCAGLAYLPQIAIVDYELTLSKPRRLTADTGIDALTHAIEAYVSRRANGFSDGMALAAMKAIWPNLRLAYAEPGNRVAREAMMLGAMQGGIAFSNSSVALVHGMSRPIGAHFHVAHGLSNAMLLPGVTAWSSSAAPGRYADCARVMGLARPEEGNEPAVALLLAALRTLNADLAVPTPRGYGIDREKWHKLIPLMAEQALASGSPANNPRIPDASEIAALYKLAWDGDDA